MSSEEHQPKPITITLPDGKIASQLVKLVVRKKPLGWSRRSYPPYYTEQYGKWMQDIFDEMIKSGKPQCIPYTLFKGARRNTVYLKVMQGIMYLLDELDGVDNKYKNFRHKIDINRHDAGVLLKFKPTESLPSSVEFVEVAAKPSWKLKIEKYLEEDNDSGRPLHIGNLALTNEEVEQQKLELSGLTDILFDVTNTDIRIVKGV